MSDYAKLLDGCAGRLEATGNPAIADFVRDCSGEIRRLTTDLASCRECLLVSGTESERRLTARVAALQEQVVDLQGEIKRLRRQNDTLLDTNEALRGAYLPPKPVPYEDLD